MTVAWSRRAADELWSGVVTPLTFSLLAEQMATHMAERRLRQAGLDEAADQPVFKLIRGHVYVNASLICDVMHEIPSVFLSDGVLALLPAELQAEMRTHQRALYDPRTLATIGRLTWNETGWLPWSRATLFREEAARVEAELAGFVVKPGTSPEMIVREMHAVRERLGEFLDVVSWAVIYAYVFFHLAMHLSDEWLGAELPVSALMAGIPGIRTFEVHRELSSLAERLRGDASLAAFVRERSGVEVIAACECDELGAFGAGLLELRRNHGHRLLARDLSFPTWAEKPEVLVDMVRRLAGLESPQSSLDTNATLDAARQRVEAGIGGSLRWRLFEAGLGWCQEYYAVRENMRYHADYFLAAFRRLALEAADGLVRRAVLADAQDVFYLTASELEGALVGSGPDTDLGGIASARRQEYEAYRLSAPPEVVWGDPDASSALPTTAEPAEERARETEFKATAASPGVVEAVVRVVRSADELDAVESGEIIVATATDPTWTTYLSLASGLVLEVGGLLSHGAIIAREMGIPAVVDLAGATTLLASGDRIRVDGTTGLVRRL